MSRIIVRSETFQTTLVKFSEKCRQPAVLTIKIVQWEREIQRKKLREIQLQYTYSLIRRKK